MKRNFSYLLIPCICFFVLSFSINSVFVNQAASKSNPDYEMVYWESVKDSEDIDMFRAYVKKFPNGIFVDLAKIKIKALEKGARQPASTVSRAAATQKPPHSPSPMLRNTPLKLEPEDLKKMLAKHRFHDWYRNHDGDFKNQFTDNGNGTIADKVTGLIWQKSGSWKRKSRRKADAYIRVLNAKKFAGRSDWRLPTIEELASLIEKRPTERDGLYIDPMFGDAKIGNWLDTCWTTDTLRAMYGADEAHWIVSFKLCSVKVASWTYPTTVTSTAYPEFEYNYVRAVCSAKQ